MTDILLLVGIISILTIDQKDAFQFGISQPIITSVIIGAFTGEYATAIYFGIIIQLMWMGNLQIGASITPSGALGSVVGCIMYTLTAKAYASHLSALLLLTFFYTVGISFIGGQIEVLIRKNNTRFQNAIYKRIAQHKKTVVGWAITKAIIVQWSVNFLFISLFLALGLLILEWLKQPVLLTHAAVWRFADIALMGTGIGMVLSLYKSRKIQYTVALLSLLGILIFKFKLV